MASSRYLIDTLKKKDRKEGITLIVTFSRRIFVPYFFSAFKDLNLPRKDIHLIVYDNTEDEPLKEELLAQVEPIAFQFKSVRFYKSYLHGKGCIVGSGNEQFKKSKLQNIWSMWLRMRKMIFTDTFFVLEDDTIAPPDCFRKLHGYLMDHRGVGFITGIETGRHAYPWIPVRLGVHRVKMQGLKIIERHSLNPHTKGIVPIDAAGVYCFAARTKAYLSGFYGYDPIALKVPFFGLDNVLTYNIKRHGWRVLADFSVWCSHLEASAARIIFFGKEQALEMVDIWLPQFNNYAHGVEVKKKHQRNRRLQVHKPAMSFELQRDDVPLPDIPSCVK